jgi:hypothetical protein
MVVQLVLTNEKLTSIAELPAAKDSVYTAGSITLRRQRGIGG